MKMEMLMITNTTGNFVSADYHQCDLDDNHEGDEDEKRRMLIMEKEKEHLCKKSDRISGLPFN